MTETNLKSNIQLKPKRNLLIMLAYALFLYAAFCELYFLVIPVKNIFMKITDCTIFYAFKLSVKFIIALIFYCLTAVMFFRIAFLNKPIEKWFRNFLYLILIINFTIIVANLKFVHIYTINGISEIFLDVFNLLAGAPLIIIIISLAFLKYSGDNNKLVKVLLNKWLIFSIIVIILLVICYKSFTSIVSYLNSVSYYKMSSIMNEAFKTGTTLLKPQFPLMQIGIPLFYSLSVVIFFISLITKKQINKVSFTIIIIFILFFATSIFIDRVSDLDADASIISLFLFPEYISIAGMCVTLGMYSICNYEAVANEKENDTEQTA